MTEAEGCAVLRGRFEAAGFNIVEKYSLKDTGLNVELDGFDPHKRVGYEYVTTAAGDRREVTPKVIDEIEARIRRGDMHVLLVDELDIDSPDILAWIADRFIARVRSAKQ